MCDKETTLQRSISSVEASHVRISRSLERVRGSMGPAPDCSGKWQGSLAKYDPESGSWRTSQRSVLGGWIPWSEQLPISGILRSGALFPGVAWEHPTAAGAGSVSLWPTPQARDWKDAGRTQGNRKSPNLGTAAAIESTGPGRLSPEWVEALMGFPPGWTDPDGPPLRENHSTHGNRIGLKPGSPEIKSD